MKVYASVVHILLALLGVSYFALEAKVVEEYCTITSTFLAVDTSRGAELVYKNSEYSNITNITFDGLYLSSTNACGLNHQRCPNLTVIVDGNIVVVVIPMQDHFGVVTYDKEGNYFSFREKHAINITGLNLDCRVSSILEYFPSKLTVIGKCLSTRTNRELHSVYVVIDSSSLSESYPIPIDGVCNVHSPSEFVFVVSATFSMGVSVFADNGYVFFQNPNDGCFAFDQISVCSDVQRFTSVSPDLQAIYCESTTYLLDLVSSPVIPTFVRDNDGLPFFCSEHSYYTYKDKTISLHHTTNKTQIGSAVPLGTLYNKDVVWGNCVNGMFVVIQLADGEVISLTVNTRKLNLIGHSPTTPPRIFGTTVLLNNFTHALIYDLQSSKLVDVISQDFVIGYVVSSPVPCMTPDDSQELQKLSSILAAILIPLMVVILYVPCGIATCWYCKKKYSRVRRKRRGFHERPLVNTSSPEGTHVEAVQLHSELTEAATVKPDECVKHADNFPMLGQADSSLIHQESVNESGQSLCVAVNADRPPKLDLADSSLIHQESVNGSGQSQSVAVNADNCPPKLDLADSTTIHQESVSGQSQSVAVNADNCPPKLDLADSTTIGQESANGSGQPQLVAGNVPKSTQVDIWPSSGGVAVAANHLFTGTSSAPANAQQLVANLQAAQNVQAAIHYGANMEVNAQAEEDVNGSARSNQVLDIM